MMRHLALPAVVAALLLAAPAAFATPVETFDLVTNAANPLWATSAFNPAYSIDHGAKAVADVMGEMKRSHGGCTEANYVAMTLAGYNQGSSTVSGCTSYSPNGTTYANNVLNQYRTFCKSAGITPVY